VKSHCWAQNHSFGPNSLLNCAAHYLSAALTCGPIWSVALHSLPLDSLRGGAPRPGTTSTRAPCIADSWTHVVGAPRSRGMDGLSLVRGAGYRDDPSSGIADGRGPPSSSRLPSPCAHGGRPQPLRRWMRSWRTQDRLGIVPIRDPLTTLLLVSHFFRIRYTILNNRVAAFRTKYTAAGESHHRVLSALGAWMGVSSSPREATGALNSS
jgi:hypothetical protein